MVVYLRNMPLNIRNIRNILKHYIMINNIMFYYLASSSLCMCFLFFVLSNGEDYKPVDNLELNMYDGRWFQVIEDLTDMSFQGFGKCAVADYSILNSNNVTVLNSQIDKDGSLDQISGYAYYKDGASGGDLTVNLEGTPGNAPYWVIELGPIISDQYQYAIVSDNFKLSLFVLARNVSEYYSEYDTIVRSSLKEYGFTKEYNKPKVMDQDGCDYSLYSE